MAVSPSRRGIERAAERVLSDGQGRGGAALYLRWGDPQAKLDQKRRSFVA